MLTPRKTGHKFGTFAGVFTPSILTILGVILFMRANFVIGQVGIKGTLIILGIAEVISLLTALSLAGISTNTPIKGGGAYYIISRVLGPEFGGSIGLALFLAQALSVPFYILGFTEAVVMSFPNLHPLFVPIALITTGFLFSMAYIGAKWAIKTQFVIMALLAVSLFVLLSGAALHFRPATFRANWLAEYSGKYSFWPIFAIYFPAVTGIMAGVNMSGDLRNPAKSLVWGTFAAIAAGGLIYLAQILICGGMASRSEMVSMPYQLLIKNALFGTGFLVTGGVFAATLSSALGSFLGAPRIMQALARDKVMKSLGLFSKGSDDADEPRRALWLTLIITLIILLVSTMGSSAKSFNLVAGVVTMFFLCTYGMINLAAFVELFSQNPSFRPRFRHFHWSISLFAAAACLVVMIFISLLAALFAVFIIVILYLHIQKSSLGATYGDARSGFIYTIVSRNLKRLEQQKIHAKNWRPTFLVLSERPERRLTLLKYADWLGAKHGMISLAQIIQGEGSEIENIRSRASEKLGEFVLENHLDIYSEVVVVKDVDEGIRVLIQAQSIGPLKPNTVLLAWPHESKHLAPFIRHLRDIRTLDKTAVCLLDRGIPKETDRRIDIWWRGRSNGTLMLILSHMLTLNWEWRRAKIRILRAIQEETGRQPAHEALTKLIQNARINADLTVIVSTDPIAQIMPKYSEHASVVFMGFEPPKTDEQARAFIQLQTELDDKIPTTILISSNCEADLLA